MWSLGALETSRKIYYLHPIEPWRPLPGLRNPGNRAISPHTEGGRVGSHHTGGKAGWGERKAKTKQSTKTPVQHLKWNQPTEKYTHLLHSANPKDTWHVLHNVTAD